MHTYIYDIYVCMYIVCGYIYNKLSCDRRYIEIGYDIYIYE